MSADLHDLEMRKNIGKAKALLHSLVPRAQSFCYYNRSADCVWSSDGAEDYEIDSFIGDLPATVMAGDTGDSSYLRRTLSSGRTVLAMPIFGAGRESLGILVALFSRNAGKASSFNPSMVANILEPAVEMVGESLRVSQRLDEAKAVSSELERELELVYEVDEKIHGTSRSHVGLAHLVGQSGRFLGINYSVLLIPSKRIRVSATHSSWKHVRRKVLDRYLIEQLLPKIEGQRWPVVFEIPTMEGAGEGSSQSYQALLCPLHDQRGNVEGVLAQLGRIDNSGFSKNDRRFMAHIMRKVEYVIEQSFDSMTGLMNRAGFESQLHESAKNVTEPEDAHQIIYFDLDNLQLVNDTFGREAGDAVIMRFARLLEEDLPKSAVLSRLTGDDFCLLLTHATVEEGLQLANDIREKGRSLRYLEGDKSLQVTMSVGIAEYNTRIPDEANALTAARMACESAKDHGRDRIEVYDEQNLSVIRRYDDMQLVAQIQQTLDGEGFDLLAQPIMTLTGETERPCFEVLLRMKKGEDGERIPTDAFLSAAERYQMMPQIDRWVVSNTIASIAKHADLVDGLNAVFAINLSGQSIGDDDILDFIDDEIRAAGVPEDSLCFEITESAAVSNLSKAQSFIDALRERGCKISLDDFGAGLSSFAYLKNFSVDTLKIDGSFIRDITDNRISESMVAAITQVAKVMKLETVAEFVETEETLELVAELGVDYAQGHVVGRPAPLEDALAEIVETTEQSTA